MKKMTIKIDDYNTSYFAIVYGDMTFEQFKKVFHEDANNYQEVYDPRDKEPQDDFLAFFATTLYHKYNCGIEYVMEWEDKYDVMEDEEEYETFTIEYDEEEIMALYQ